MMEFMNNQSDNNDSDESNVDQVLIDCVHDILVELEGIKPSNIKILEVIRFIPQSILSIGRKWGYRDTVFGDELYEWISESDL